jgi:hypothetical protein
MPTTITVPAEEVKVGDMIPGLDNGYVFDTDDTSDRDGYMEITFHDADGEECYLTVPPNMPMTVTREA